MTLTLEIVLIIVAAVVAAVVTALLFSGRLAHVRQTLALSARELEASTRNLESCKAEIASLESALETCRKESESARARAITAEAQLEANALLLKAKDEQIKTVDEKFREQLQASRTEMLAATEKILKDRSESLSKGNRDSMDEILKPLKESMDDMRKAMNANAADHVKSNTELKAQLENAVKEMGSRTADIGAKADSLSEALTGRPKVQGCWGENYLDSILAAEGLERGVHYEREDANDDRSRPDFVFHFREGGECRDLVVDSKVSLTAFVEYMNAADEASKANALERHVKSVRKHIEELSQKEYAKKIDRSRRFADYVLMFMPIDMAYRVAIDADPMLWQDAYSKGVLISTEQTIMPFLKIIQLTWNKYQQDSNILEITRAAEAMIDRVAQFYDSYKDLGKKLKAVLVEYNDGVGKLRDDGRSITTSARQVMKIGVKRSKGKEFAVPEETVSIEGEEISNL